MFYAGIVDGRDGAWGVRIPDLPGCHGAGATLDDAVADATSAAREWIAFQRDHGAVIPRGRTLDDIRHDPDESFDPSVEALVLIEVSVLAPA